jgi:glycosyltransferase A (GT-A) superfamily protein (DUF2064 family)
MMQSTAIIVFARAPQLGHVKTRLIPALGAHGALALYRAMLWHALHIADECAVDELILACTPDTENAELQAMARQIGATLAPGIASAPDSFADGQRLSIPAQ